MPKPARKLDPIPPGEVLLEEFMKPLGLSQNRLARDLDVNPARVSDLVHGRAGITAAMALRLAACFGTTPEFWMTLQLDYDLRRAKRDIGARITARVRAVAASLWVIKEKQDGWLTGFGFNACVVGREDYCVE